MLTTSILMLQRSTRRMVRLTAGTVSPSAALVCAAVGADLKTKKMLLYSNIFFNNVNGSTDWDRTSDLGLMSPTL